VQSGSYLLLTLLKSGQTVVEAARRSLADRGPWAVVGDVVEAKAGSIAEDEARDTGTGRGSLHGCGCPVQRRTCAPSGHCLLPPHTPADDS
jgi:hypothetical protein